MRRGAKKRPYYRVVVIDQRRPRESKAKEIIGIYDPLKEPAEVRIDLERANHWLSKGARASKTVQSLLHKVSESETQSA
jgi:small subunit ribosomal protein S16